MAPPLIAAGVDLHVAYLVERAGLDADLRAAGAELHRVRGRRRFDQARSFRQLIRRIEPDLVHTTLTEADVIGRVAAGLERVPCVSSLVNVQYGPESLADPNVARWRLRGWQLADALSARTVSRFHAASRSRARRSTSFREGATHLSLVRRHQGEGPASVRVSVSPATRCCSRSEGRSSRKDSMSCSKPSGGSGDRGRGRASVCSSLVGKVPKRRRWIARSSSLGSRRRCGCWATDLTSPSSSVDRMCSSSRLGAKGHQVHSSRRWPWACRRSRVIWGRSERLRVARLLCGSCRRKTLMLSLARSRASFHRLTDPRRWVRGRGSDSSATTRSIP